MCRPSPKVVRFWLFSSIGGRSAIAQYDDCSGLAGGAAGIPLHGARRAVHGDLSHRGDHLLVEVSIAGLRSALLQSSLDGIDGIIAVRCELVGRGAVSRLVIARELDVLLVGVGVKRGQEHYAFGSGNVVRADLFEDAVKAVAADVSSGRIDFAYDPQE